MALTVMTPEWTAFINSITVFLVRKRSENEQRVQNLAQNPLHLFNAWARESGTAVEDTEMALWLADYAQKMTKMPLSRLKLGAEIDNLVY